MLAVVAPGSGATDGERANAQAILDKMGPELGALRGRSQFAVCTQRPGDSWCVTHNAYWRLGTVKCTRMGSGTSTDRPLTREDILRQTARDFNVSMDDLRKAAEDLGRSAAQAGEAFDRFSEEVQRSQREAAKRARREEQRQRRERYRGRDVGPRRLDETEDQYQMRMHRAESEYQAERYRDGQRVRSFRYMSGSESLRTDRLYPDFDPDR